MLKRLLIPILATRLAGCSIPDGYGPLAYTPTTDARCVNFDVATDPTNVDYCHALGVQIRNERYKGWRMNDGQ